MKSGKLAILFLIAFILLISSSCGRLEAASGNGDQVDETRAPVVSPSDSPIPSDGENEQTTEPPEASPGGQATPAPGTTSNAAIQPVKWSDTGMEPLPVSDLNGKELADRLAGLADGSVSWGIEDYTDGIDFYNGVLIALPRFSGAIAGRSGIGSSFKEITTELGKSSYAEAEMIIYRTSDFYLGFFGRGKAEYAAIFQMPGKDYDKDILYQLIEELNSGTYSSLDESIDKVDPEGRFFDERGFINGGGYYANSIYGVNVTDFDERIIDVLNNFEGNLYSMDPSQARYSQSFNNLDAVVMKLRDTQGRYQEIDELFNSEGKSSPDGKLKAIYEWIYSMDQHFIIRTLDHTIQDRYIYVMSTGDYYWLDSEYILYVDFLSNAPFVIDINQDMPPSVNVLQEVGIADQDDLDSLSYSFKVTQVKDQVITVTEENSGKAYNIKYTIDGNGKINFILN